MDVFTVRDEVIADYRAFTTSFVHIRDRRLRAYSEERLDAGAQWPEPWLSLNPAFASGGSIADLVEADLLHPESERIFRAKSGPQDAGRAGLRLHRHQRDAVEAARSGDSYVLTTGTGSGKSLAYIVPIVDHVLRRRAEGAPKGVKAIIVYPMNALANSQVHELEKFLKYGYSEGGEPVTFARYTGQEKDEERRRILADPPDILLTNYVMLELVLTRPEERRHLVKAATGLQFLVLDELHTYRGRQGADVALLVRRVREACAAQDVQVVGTSATMATGRPEEQRAVVASVATQLFGTEVRPERVIGETLERVTPEVDREPAELARSIDDPPANVEHDEFLRHPLTGWVESTFGLRADETGRLLRQRPVRVPDAAARLAEFTGRSIENCLDAVKTTLLTGSRVVNPVTNRPVFAFRLHQFLSKGDTLHVSLEPEDTRHITDQYQLRVPGQQEKTLLPLGFCRECGQDYLVVARTKRRGQVQYLPRQDKDASGGDDITGYLYVSSDYPWPKHPEKENRVPDHWLIEENNETVVRPSSQKYLPREVWLTPDGMETSPGDGLRAWFTSTPFAFCLRCKVSYEQVRGNDFGKLATLDREGRSSAMTVVGASVVRQLRSAAADDLPPEARKLLTFVDNRQDAALQAGHLNDFVQVAQLRGALTRALEKSGGGLTHQVVAQAVADELGLGMGDFAQNPAAKYSARESAFRALRDIVEYRLYGDLKRGWRVTMPNLEQTGLLRVEYVDLPEIAAADEDWTGTGFAGVPAPLRLELCRILLDEFRRVLAIDVDCLTAQGFERLQRDSRQLLTGPWALGESERMIDVGVARARGGRPGGSRTDLNLSGLQAFGRYLRRADVLGAQLPHHDDAQQLIRQIITVLDDHHAGLLATVTEDGGDRGHRIKASALRWAAGDGSASAADPLRRTVDSETTSRVNPFFRDLYATVSADLAGLHAQEHTAQVSSDEREEREEKFRAGSLPMLFCSPTMELGVDIASLNAVGLRNVPPTPANYAQRSGRAGRSGQPALVVTYCATGNAHDSYYFRNSDQMVAGSVVAPRLDLGNEDLVRSHVHGVWLAETGVALRAKITDILDSGGEDPSLEIIPDVMRDLLDPEAQRRAVRRAESVFGELARGWSDSDAVSWWYDGWIADQVNRAPDLLDEAFDRWRLLFTTARREFQQQSAVSVDSKAGGFVKDQAARRAAEARQQLKLLANEEAERGNSDFYSYRYLASEGFLPGYSFPRLPLAAYIPGSGRRRQDGDYIQRPRFLAISEFGPGSLIYHEGSRYEVVRVQLPRRGDDAASLDTDEATRCGDCGYHHPVAVGTDVCANCGTALGVVTRRLLRLQTVFTRRRERISSDEEERRRSGFELEVSYRFNDRGDRPGRLDAAASSADGASLMTLAYGDSATVRVANVGRRRRKDPEVRGFWLDPVEGRWLAEKSASDATVDTGDLPDLEDSPRRQQVIPYVEDRRNVLVVRSTAELDDPTAATLRVALERGAEVVFQLEDSELESQSLPDGDGKGRMLLTEVAEGGAGALRRLVGEPGALAQVARAALEVCHFDPETGVDRDRASGAPERCERGCYDCLLSYRNQWEHSLIDRHAVRDLLLALAGTTVTAGAGGRTRGKQRELLEAMSDSGLEVDFVTWLDEQGLRLPDRSQILVPDAQARPDLVYDRPGNPVAVFVDGPVHERPSVAQRDAEAEERLLDLGWSVVRIAHDADWAAVVARHPSVFGTRSGGSQ